MNEESRRNEPKEAALREFFQRVNRGEPVDREELVSQHAPGDDPLQLTAAEQNVPKLGEAVAPPDFANDSTRSFAAQGQETIAPQPFGKRVLAAETEGTGLAVQFGRYRIIRALGKGGMGTVYLGMDAQIERQVALKTPHFTEDPTGEQMQRFIREARSAGNLRHPNICPIYDFGEIDGRHFITMAYIEGRPLSAYIQPDKPQPERQILIVIRKLALALQAAHDKGIVHRDLKPANIMVDTSGEPIIMDFGLARHASGGGDIRLTQTGNILGTPAFMSPEQVEGEPDKIGPATDQYSLGVILYELLTGQLPFRGSVIAVMGQILTKEPKSPGQWRPETDQRVEAVCLKMMAKTPSERFASLKAVADELAAILSSPASKAASRLKSVRHREPAIPEKHSGFSKGDTERRNVFTQFRQRPNDGRWIRWSMLGVGLAIVGVMAAVVVINPRKVAVVDTGISPSTTSSGQSAATPTADGTKPPLMPTPAFEEQTAAALTPTFKNSLGIEFVLVPKGKSWLGGGDGRPGDKEVAIGHDLYLGKYEVTQDEWEKVTGLTPSWFSRTGGGKGLVKDIADAELKRFPVENVGWDDVQAFLERLNNREKVAGWVYRLPHAAEWEYVCRGGPLVNKSECAYDFYVDEPTNLLLPDKANSNRGLERTCPVGSYQPNRLGLYDMHGNVWEWCSDPERPVDGGWGREARGGGWSTAPIACKAAYRGGPARWEGRVGLRLARSRE